MTTKAAGGKITGLLALTMEAQEATSLGDYVHIIGDYEVAIADGTKPVLGRVSVSNRKGRVSTAYSTSTANAIVPGDVTVEARGFYVTEEVASGVITAGDSVVVGATGQSVAAYDSVGGDTADQIIGIALMGAAIGGALDVLIN